MEHRRRAACVGFVALLCQDLSKLSPQWRRVWDEVGVQSTTPCSCVFGTKLPTPKFLRSPTLALNLYQLSKTGYETQTAFCNKDDDGV